MPVENNEIRNTQVVRQWRILLEVASTQQADPHALSQKFNVTAKTIRRDLHALAEAGFFAKHVVKASARSVEEIEKEPDCDSYIEDIRKLSTEGFRYYAAGKCGCGYPYKYHPQTFRMDWADFQEHAEECEVWVNAV